MDWIIVVIIVIIVIVILYLLSRPRRVRPYQNLTNIPVMDVDLNRYAGRWYEIARTPNSYQTFCVDSAQAEYELSGERLLVRNSCRTANGTYQVEGVATPNRPAVAPNVYPGSFTVQFQNYPGSGQYNIVYVDPEYEYAIVVGGNGEVWILSRDDDISKRTYLNLINLANRLGYDANNLIVNPSIEFE